MDFDEAKFPQNITAISHDPLWFAVDVIDDLGAHEVEPVTVPVHAKDRQRVSSLDLADDPVCAAGVLVDLSGFPSEVTPGSSCVGK